MRELEGIAQPWKFQNSRLQFTNDILNHHRERVIDQTFGHSVAEEQRVFKNLWMISLEYEVVIQTFNVTVVYDFGNLSNLRVPFDFPRSMGTTIYEVMLRFVGTMFNQPLSRFYVDLNGKRIPEYTLHTGGKCFLDNDVVTLRPQVLGLMGGGGKRKPCTRDAVISDLSSDEDSESEEEKTPISAQRLQVEPRKHGPVSTTTTVTTTKAGIKQKKIKRLAVVPREGRRANVQWADIRSEGYHSSTSPVSSQSSTPLLTVAAELAAVLPTIDTYRNVDPNLNVTVSNSETSSIASASQESKEGEQVLLDREQKRLLQRFVKKVDTEQRRLHSAFHLLLNQLAQLQKLKDATKDFLMPSSRTMDGKIAHLMRRLADIQPMEGYALDKEALFNCLDDSEEN